MPLPAAKKKSCSVSFMLSGNKKKPVMPDACGKLLDQLAVPADQRDFKALGSGGRLKAGTALGTLAPIFPRYVEPEGDAS